MDKPRRRAAGRPAGPPNIVAAESTAAPPAAAPSERPQASSAPTSSGHDLPEQTDQPGQQHRRRQRPARQPNAETGLPARGDRDVPAREPEPPQFKRQRQSSAQSPGRDDRRRGESPVERSLRALVSTRTTQLPPTVAMRAREVAAPSRADLAEAEQELVIVRRHYVPPAPLATTGKTADQKTPVKRPTEGKRGARRPQQG